MYPGLADAAGDGDGTRKYEADAAAPIQVGHQGDAGSAPNVSRGLDAEDASKHVSRSSPPASPPCSSPSVSPSVDAQACVTETSLAASASGLHAAAHLMLHPLASSTSHVLDVIRPPSCSLEKELEKELVVDPTMESTTPADEADEEEEEEQRLFSDTKAGGRGGHCASRSAACCSSPSGILRAAESSGSDAVLKDGILAEVEENAHDVRTLASLIPLLPNADGHDKPSV